MRDPFVFARIIRLQVLAPTEVKVLVPESLFERYSLAVAFVLFYECDKRNTDQQPGPPRLDLKIVMYETFKVKLLWHEENLRKSPYSLRLLIRHE